MEPVPLFGFDPANDRVVRPLLGDGVAGRDRYQQTGFSAFVVHAVWDSARGFPLLCLVHDILLDPFADYISEVHVAGLVVW